MTRMANFSKSSVVTKTFAPKFCAECTDRHIHSSHRDYFCDHFCVCVSGQLSGNFRATFKQLPGNFRATSGQLPDNLWATFGQHSGNFRSTFGQLSDNFRTTFGQLSDNFRATSGQLAVDFWATCVAFVSRQVLCFLA